MFRFHNEMISLNDNYEIADQGSLLLIDRVLQVKDFFNEFLNCFSYFFKIYNFVKNVFFYIYFVVYSKKKLVNLALKNIIFGYFGAERGSCQFFMTNSFFQSSNTHSNQISCF
jgi:hypothetical protein